jgi:Xaa-Pro aminopeptidase
MAVPRSEIEQRLARLREHLAAVGLDGALLHGITNLYYYTGTAQQAHLWVPAAGEPVLLVRRVLERARFESPLEQVEPLTSLRALADRLGGARRIGMELDIMPVSLFGAYQKALPGLDATDIGPFVRLSRAVKSEWEIDRIRNSAAAADQTYRAAQNALQEGMTELELSVAAEAADRLAGNQGIVRWHATTGFECPRVHLLAGESLLAFSFADTPFGGEGLTPAAPLGAGRREIRRAMPVCLDYPTVVDGYVHDMTRTLALGALDPKLLHAYAVCQEILAMVAEQARPGITGEELYNRAAAIAAAAGLEEHFMGYGPNRVKFLGHGVGLELDELPVLAPRQQQPLAAGNVIAVEPKFFFPGLGAVGLENTYAVRAAGAEKLTISSDEPYIK